MNILSINDTCITNKDCIAKQLKEMTDTCLAYAKESATNTCDVDIANSVSTTVIVVVAICAGAYLLSKLIAFWQTSRQSKRKREWDNEDKDRKQKSDLLYMKLEMMKALCNKTEKVGGSEQKNEKGSEQKYEKMLKPSDDKDVKNYLAELNNYGNDLPLKSKNDKQ